MALKKKGVGSRSRNPSCSPTTMAALVRDVLVKLDEGACTFARACSQVEEVSGVSPELSVVVAVDRPSLLQNF